MVTTNVIRIVGGICLFFGIFFIYNVTRQAFDLRCWSFDAFAQIDNIRINCDVFFNDRLTFGIILFVVGILIIIMASNKKFKKPKINYRNNED